MAVVADHDRLLRIISNTKQRTQKLDEEVFNVKVEKMTLIATLIEHEKIIMFLNAENQKAND